MPTEKPIYLPWFNPSDFPWYKKVLEELDFYQLRSRIIKTCGDYLEMLRLSEANIERVSVSSDVQPKFRDWKMESAYFVRRGHLYGPVNREGMFLIGEITLDDIYGITDQDAFISTALGIRSVVKRNLRDSESTLNALSTVLKGSDLDTAVYARYAERIKSVVEGLENNDYDMTSVVATLKGAKELIRRDIGKALKELPLSA